MPYMWRKLCRTKRSHTGRHCSGTQTTNQGFNDKKDDLLRTFSSYDNCRFFFVLQNEREKQTITQKPTSIYVTDIMIKVWMFVIHKLKSSKMFVNIHTDSFPYKITGKCFRQHVSRFVGLSWCLTSGMANDS